MSSSGGGGAAPVAPTFADPVNGMSFTDAQALNAEIAQRQAQEKQTSDQQLSDNAQQNGWNESGFQNELTYAQQRAKNDATQYFTDNGYDPSKYGSQIDAAIARAAAGVYDPNNGAGTSTPVSPGSFAPAIAANFSPNLGAQILEGINSGVRSKATNAVSNQFSPTYAEDNISDSWLSPAATSALDAQFSPLGDQLTNAQKRGTLNDQGYAAALKALGGARTAAQSTVNNLGTNILNNDRSNLNDYITGAKNDAAGLNASTADSFDPGKYLTGAQGRVAADQGNFYGDLTNAIGKTQFSDLGTLLNAGGVVQGANDPTATNPTPGGAPGGGGVSDAFIAQQALANQKRGLGSSGAF